MNGWTGYWRDGHRQAICAMQIQMKTVVCNKIAIFHSSLVDTIWSEQESVRLKSKVQTYILKVCLFKYQVSFNEVKYNQVPIFWGAHMFVCIWTDKSLSIFIGGDHLAPPQQCINLHSVSDLNQVFKTGKQIGNKFRLKNACFNLHTVTPIAHQLVWAWKGKKSKPYTCRKMLK